MRERKSAHQALEDNRVIRETECALFGHDWLKLFGHDWLNTIEHYYNCSRCGAQWQPIIQPVITWSELKEEDTWPSAQSKSTTP